MNKVYLVIVLFIVVLVGGVVAIKPNIPRSLDEIPTPAKLFRSNIAVAQPITSSNQEGAIHNSEINEEKLDCYLCHEPEFTKTFHVPERIIKIEIGKDKRRRLCVDCHGVEGANADRQMNKPEDIIYDPEIGLNGLFKLNPNLPHQIHQKKLEKGQMSCEACHLTDPNSFDMEIPEALTEKGQVLVCQNCKFHPEGGNYITIHVEVSGLWCTTCHTGEILEVHQEATSKLGVG